jgi:hypothetical protein
MVCCVLSGLPVTPVKHFVGAHLVVVADQQHRFVGSKHVPFGQHAQVFAVEFQPGQALARRVLACLPHHHCVALQHEFGVVGVAGHTLSSGGGQQTFRAVIADAGLVDFQRIGVGVVPALRAVHLGLDAPVGVENLHRKALHPVVGFVHGFRFDRRYRGNGCGPQQPVGTQRQHAHEQDGQVDRELVPDTVKAPARRALRRPGWMVQWQCGAHRAAASNAGA